MAIPKIRNLLLIVSLATFAIALILRYFLIDNFRSDAQYLKDVNQNIEQALRSVEQEVNSLSKRITTVGEINFTNLTMEVSYPYFLYRNDSLVYWSDYRFVPNYEKLRGDFTYRFTQLESGDYLARQAQFSLNEDELELFILLPIFRKTDINNKYLNPGYNTTLFIQDGIQINPALDAGLDDTIITYEGQDLFSLSLDPQFREARGHQTAQFFQAILLVLFTFAIVLFLFSIKVEVDLLMQHKRIGEGIVLLVISLVFLRFLMLNFNFPNGILASDLFNGKFYASSVFNPSLGDLLLNALASLLITWYLFRFYPESLLYRKLLFANRYTKYIAAVLMAVLSFYTLYYHYYCLKTIYFNSQLTLDITKSIDFSLLKILSLGVIGINTATFFLVMHMLYRTFITLSGRRNVLITFGAGWLLAIFCAYFMATPPYHIIIINIIYVTLLYLLNLPRYLTRVGYTTFLYLFWGALASAIVGALAMYSTEQITITSNKQKFANQILIDNDVLGEFLLADASEKIKQDMFILSRWLTPSIFSPNDIVKEKIKRFYLSSYFDKYDIDIYLYNSRGKPLTNDQKAVDYQKLKDEVFKERFKTADYSNIFFINQPGSGTGNASKRYLCFIDLVRGGSTRGYIVIDLKLKRFFPNSVYPELLIDRRYASAIPDRGFHYAEMNKKGAITYSTGNDEALKLLKANYNFQHTSSIDEELVLDGYHYLIVKSKEDEVIVIMSDAYSFWDIMSNFSFLFIVFVSLILLFLAFYTIYFLIRGNTLNFSTKIQLYLNAAFFIPLLAVSITTLSIISNTYSDEVTDDYLNKAEGISSSLVEVLDNYQQGEIEEENLSNVLTQAAKYTESDINLYDTNGKLIVSSQPQIYENNLLSRYINPRALANIEEQDNNQLILDESVGSLNYKSSYIGVRSFNTGNLLGILSIPFFESQNQLEQQIIMVLTNVINIFTLIFIIFLVISYVASNALTFPLRYVTQKLKRTSLSDYNEPLSWDSDDEIGLMIGEYNRMLVKLEASKEALSRSEKESAWREMAKQVAHEIKNPLTPMKLSLQHMKRVLEKAYAITGNGDNQDKDAAIKPIDNLLDQVDTLNEIATSFSSFAQMPLPKNEYFDLAPVIKRTVELFQDEQRSIQLHIEKGGFGVESDSHLMSRIISNLIINAKQSVPQGRLPKIHVSLQRGVKGFLILKVSDNGSGIAREIQDKIFLPNFSTKYAGSGIGLAIAKRGIEHSGGRITFETKQQTGTTFYIELPLAYQV